MVVKLLGKEQVTFTAKDTGEIVNFYRLYITYADQEVEGIKAQEIRCNAKLADAAVVGKDHRLDYMPDKFGKAKLVNISVV